MKCQGLVQRIRDSDMAGRNLHMLRYMAGCDFLEKRFEAERQLKIDARGTEDVLATECGLGTAVKIYALKTRSLVEYPIVLFLRNTGLDHLHHFYIENR